MARKDKPDLSNVFAKTDQAGKQEAEATGPTITKGVGLKASEWAELEDIGAGLNSTTHAMTAYAVRFFLKKYRSGEIQTEQKPTLPGL